MAEFFTGPAPVEVPSGTTCDPIAFPELASAGPPPTIFLRVAVLGGPPTVAPAFTLHTDLGPALPLTEDFAPVVADDGTVVATAATAADPDGTHRIRIIAEQLGTRWSLGVSNADAITYRVTGVVANSADGTRLPWIDVPGDLSFVTAMGRPQTQKVWVTNSGPGALRVSAPAGPASAFALGGVPVSVPPAGRADLSLTFTPAAPGLTTATYTVPSDDPAPTDLWGHNHVIRISTRTSLLGPGTVLALLDGPSLVAVDPKAGARVVTSGAPLVGFGSPMVENDGHVLLVELGGERLVRVDPSNGSKTELRFDPPVPDLRRGAIAPDGTVVVVAGSPGADQVLARLSPATGRSQILCGDDHMADPFVARIPAVAGDGTVYEVQGKLLRLDGPGQRRVLQDSSNFPEARSIAVDGQGRVLVGCIFRTAGGGFVINEGLVKRVDVPAGTVTGLVGDQSMTPDGIAVEADGHIVVADSGASSVRRYDADGGVAPSLAGLPAGRPTAVAVVR